MTSVPGPIRTDSSAQRDAMPVQQVMSLVDPTRVTGLLISLNKISTHIRDLVDSASTADYNDWKKDALKTLKLVRITEDVVAGETGKQISNALHGIEPNFRVSTQQAEAFIVGSTFLLSKIEQ